MQAADAVGYGTAGYTLWAGSNGASIPVRPEATVCMLCISATYGYALVTGYPENTAAGE
jgi:hypothetical protein